MLARDPSGRSTFCSGTADWHGQNPRFYKFKWWIFHEGSLAQGSDFLLNEKYALSTKDAMEIQERLRKEGKSFYIYHRRYRRNGSDTPFRQPGEGDQERKFALSFDDDPDPMFEGHK